MNDLSSKEILDKKETIGIQQLVLKVSIIIPVYNEEATLHTLITKVLDAHLPPGLSKETVIVNDGSTDRTREILNSFSGLDGITVVHQNNQGKTGALLTGFKNASGDIFLVQDADLEYDPSQYAQLLQPIVEGRTQVVYGSRFSGSIQGMAPVNRWANQVSNWTVNLLYGTNITDINSCYKIFTRPVLESITIKGRNFDFDTEATVKILLNGVTIMGIPIHYVARPHGAGKKINWSTAMAMYWQIIKYRFCHQD